MISVSTAESIRKGFDFIAQGVFSKVYAHPDKNFVHKQSKGDDSGDGTYVYLKWCITEIEAGRWMKGMPEIYLLEDVVGNFLGAADGYIAHIKKYKPIQRTAEWCKENGYDYWGTSMVVHHQHRCPEYIRKLEAKFIEDFGVGFNDLHDGNVMQDADGTWIVTDPISTRVRCPLKVQKELNEGLQLELY